MNEETLIVTVDLPSGLDWRLYSDLNMVGLGSHLDESGRERALSELQDAWRREFVRVVPDPIGHDGVSSDRLVS